MTYQVEWSRAAVKELLKIPKRQRLLLASWVKENLDGCENPRAVPGGKQMQGTDDGWRWRVGSYRVLGRIRDDVLEIKVVRVGHRQGVYKNIPKM
mgnify:CR=1 FL=1